MITLFVEAFEGLQALKQSLQDMRINQDRIISILDLLTTIFDGRKKYQKIFVDIGGIGSLADIFKTHNDMETLGYGFDCLLFLAESEADWSFIMFKNGMTDSLLNALRSLLFQKTSLYELTHLSTV